MTEQLCDFPTCKLAREKGFDAGCRHAWEWYEYGGQVYGPTAIAWDRLRIHVFSPQERAYMDDQKYLQLTAMRNQIPSLFSNRFLPPWLFARPTQDLLERWLREVHRIVITIRYFVGPGYYYADLGILTKALGQDGVPGAPFVTFELAREAAINYALTLLP